MTKTQQTITSARFAQWLKRQKDYFQNDRELESLTIDKETVTGDAMILSEVYNEYQTN